MTFRFWAGHKALDFVNTANGTGGDKVERLHSYSDVVAWLEQAGIVERATGELLLRQGSAKTFSACVAVRSALRAVCEKLVRGRRVTEADLAPFNSLLGEVRVRADAFREGSEFVRRVVPLIERPQDVPSALAWLATDVLAHAARIRRCANEESCTLFFLDETKNHTRVWCSMKDCGNRAKAAAFRARARNATVTESKR